MLFSEQLKDNTYCRVDRKPLNLQCCAAAIVRKIPFRVFSSSWRFSKAKLLNVLRQTHALMQYPNDTEAVRIFSIDDDMGADQIGEVR